MVLQMTGILFISAVGLSADPVELPDPTGLTTGEASEVDAHLAQIEAARAKQLEALPSTSIDTVTAAHRESLHRILAEVRSSRARLATGGYGVCVRCEQQIPRARLEVRPWATTCIACAS